MPKYQKRDQRRNSPSPGNDIGGLGILSKLGKTILVIVATAAIFWACYLLLRGHNFAVLNPSGEVAQKQKSLIIFTSALSLMVVMPVFALAILFAVKYSAKNQKAKYTPDWDRNTKLELVWWAIPVLIIGLLSVVTWQTSHSLNPSKPLVSGAKPLTVQVVALNWKWLFIYPEQGVATVNELNIPVNRPVKFEITADAPMNSFWIPQLGSQIYAMPGMQTQLNLVANKVGTFDGSSANLSGAGFAGMHFKAHSLTEDGFKAWQTTALGSGNSLNQGSYGKLAEPSQNNPVMNYVLVDSDLYNSIIMKYMQPTYKKPGEAPQKHLESKHTHGE